MKIELQPADVCRLLGSLEMRLENNKRSTAKSPDMESFYNFDSQDIQRIINLIILQTGVKW